MQPWQCRLSVVEEPACVGEAGEGGRAGWGLLLLRQLVLQISIELLEASVHSPPGSADNFLRLSGEVYLFLSCVAKGKREKRPSVNWRDKHNSAQYF